MMLYSAKLPRLVQSDSKPLLTGAFFYAIMQAGNLWLLCAHRARRCGGLNRALNRNGNFVQRRFAK